MKEECSSKRNVVLHLQDRCDLSKEDAEKFMDVLHRLGYVEQVSTSLAFTFTVEIPDHWAEIFCLHMAQ